MKWQSNIGSKGDYLLACHNTANGIKFLSLIKVLDDGGWTDQDGNGLYFGKHIHVVRVCKLTFPRIHTQPVPVPVGPE